MLQSLEIAPTVTLTGRQEGVNQVVLLHGWGANAQDLQPLASSLGLPHCHFWFPEAPFPHPHNPVGKAWFELNAWTGLEESTEKLQQWMLGLEERSGIPLSQTVLAGFSQGGAMAMRVGLELEPPLAGVVSLSGFLAGAPNLLSRKTAVPPTLIVHGRQDPVVVLDYARQSRQLLESLNVKVEYFELDCAHEIPGASIALVGQFLKRLPPAASK